MFTPISFSGKLFKLYLNSFAHPFKIRIQNFFGSNLFSKGIKFKDTDGCMYCLDANDWITRILMLDGNYESGSTSLAKKIMQPGGLFVDVGTNFGLFTCQVAKSNAAVRVISIEPNYKIIGQLLKNIELNNLQQAIKVFNMAVSDRIQFVTMQQPAKDNAGTTQTVAGISGELAILSSPLSYIFEQLNISNVDLLKIDIEGNEFSALSGFPFDKYHVRNIIMEFNHLSEVSLEELISFFETHGFKAFTINNEPLLNHKQEIAENNILFVNKNLGF